MLAATYRVTLTILFTAAACLSVYALLINLNGPVLDAFGFRQTQTAISTFYLMRGSSIFSYETPVLGYPWSIPFEFPIYQLITAGLSKLFGHLDATGRLVSYAFFLLCAYPIAKIYTIYRVPQNTFIITLILTLASPLYILYSRAFLIETTALFFSLMWIWLFCLTLQGCRSRTLLLCIGFGTLAVLTKSTTFLSATIFAAVMMAPPILRLIGQGSYLQTVRRLFFTGIVTLLPIAIGYGWVIWTDEVKELNLFASYLTSTNLRAWNFGFSGQRISLEFWSTISTRIPIDLFGHVSLAALIPIGLGIALKPTRLLSIAAMVTVLGTLLLFPNLHFVHSYYQTSIGVFAIIACSLGIAATFERASRPLALVMLVAIGSSQLYFSYKHTLVIIRNDQRNHQYYMIAQITKANTQPNDGIVVFGSDWSSEIPYYAERRAIAVPGWISDDQLVRLAGGQSDLLDGLHIGGVIICMPVGRPAMQAAANQLIASMSLKGEAAPCKMYAPAK